MIPPPPEHGGRVGDFPIADEQQYLHPRTERRANGEATLVREPLEIGGYADWCGDLQGGISPIAKLSHDVFFLFLFSLKSKKYFC